MACRVTDWFQTLKRWGEPKATLPAGGRAARLASQLARGRCWAPRVMRRVALAVAIAFSAASSPTPTVGASNCTGWTSESSPPSMIRVLRTTGPIAGSVAVVPFRDYVATVLPAEWRDGPAAAVRAGAIAVKQYAWYWTIHWRGHTASDGECYDVSDSTIDQLYAPETQQPTQADLDAIEATWPVTLRLSGQFFATGYRHGSDAPCGADADGRLLYQVSLYRCAVSGMDLDAMLHRYLDPGLEIIADSPAPPAPNLTFVAPPTIIQWGNTAAFTVRLGEPTGSPTSLAGRVIRLESSPDGGTWFAVTTAISDGQGAATFAYRPATNLRYRAAFDATADLGPAVSQTIRVVVRQLVVPRFSSPVAISPGRTGGTIALSATVRPVRSGSPVGVVAFQLWRSVHGRLAPYRTFTRVPGDGGKAVLTIHLSSGVWGVRIQALPTVLNANSAWTAIRRVAIP